MARQKTLSVQETRGPPQNHCDVTRTRVINEVIIADDYLPELVESLSWLAPDAVRLEDDRYLIVLDVPCEDARLAPAYCLRRLRKAAAELDIVLATGEPEVVLSSSLA